MTTPLDLDQIEARAALATAGPWENMTDRMNALLRKSQHHGRFSRTQLLYLVASTRFRGEIIHDDGFPLTWDLWDLKQVLRLQWHQVKRGPFVGPPRAEDLNFIAAARTDVPALCSEVRALRAENERLRALVSPAP